MRSQFVKEDGPHVLGCAAVGVIEAISASGGDPDRVLGEVRFSRREVEDPQAELDLRGYCNLFETAARQTQDDNFGLRFGSRFHPRRLGALGYVAVSSPTMAASVRALCTYFPSLQESSTLTLRQEEDLLYLEYRINDGRIVCRRQDAELTLGVLCNVFWHCFGQRWCPLEVHFEHPAPRTGSEQSTLLQAPIYFSQPSNALVFRRGDLDAVMHSADPYLLALLEPLLQERQRKVRSDDLVGMVCSGIERRFSGGEPSLSQVAHDLGMSRRILQRNLQERAVAYSDLVRGVRRDLATRYLAEPHIPLTEIAFMLGYSELSAFSRAFRQWTGLPPRRYRNQSAEMQRGTRAGSQPADHPKAW